MKIQTMQTEFLQNGTFPRRGMIRGLIKYGRERGSGKLFKFHKRLGDVFRLLSYDALWGNFPKSCKMTHPYNKITTKIKLL